MSADRWNTCPKCKVIAEQNRIKLARKAEKSYGKVSSEQYLRMLEDVKNGDKQDERETLREDFYIGLDEDGEFSIDYSASCDKCGFKHTFEYKKTIVKSNDVEVAETDVV